MPEIYPFHPRRSSVSVPSYRTSSPTGTSAVRRAPGFLSRLWRWLADGIDWRDTVVYSEGTTLCDLCHAVYDDEANHVCVTSAYCKRCNWRQVLDDRKCSTCGSPDVVLLRRGL